VTPSAAPGSSPAPVASPAAGASPAAVAGYVKEQQTVNYANSQTIEKIIQQPGAIKRLSVAVLLDQAAMGSISAENLKKSIEAAIGADATRGDNISVAAVPFAAASATTDGSGGGGIVDTIGGTVGSVIGGLVALVLVFLVWRNLKALRRRADDMQLLTAGPANQALLEAGYSSTGAAASIAPLPEFGETPQAKIQERLRIVADEKPEEIVGLVNSWLRTDGRPQK
jgi:flagellar M-ring protein FliF